MRHDLMPLLVLCAILPILASSPSTAAVEPAKLERRWEQVRETDGIKVFKRDIPGSAIVAFKGTGLIDAPVAKVATVIFDTTRAPEWIEDLEESKILRWISPNEYVEYDHIRTPPIIMKDRDFVSVVRIEAKPRAQILEFRYRSQADLGVPENPKYVRGELMNTVFILEPEDGGKKTRLVGEIECDPKGSVPKFLVNFFQSDWPVDTIRGLRKQVAKPGVATDPRFEAMLKVSQASR